LQSVLVFLKKRLNERADQLFYVISFDLLPPIIPYHRHSLLSMQMWTWLKISRCRMSASDVDDQGPTACSILRRMQPVLSLLIYRLQIYHIILQRR